MRKAWNQVIHFGRLGCFATNKVKSSQAKDLYVQSLAILEQISAPPTDISVVLDDLAKVYTREQQWVLAKQTWERALDIDRRVLGDDHPRVAFLLENLAIVAQNMGELKQAEALYLDALQREERAYGDRHPETVW